ncbi:MAG: mitochondrial fission ELM1 family protein [Caulobacteraceae bacterium]|nr:mitochondrial fission ELM1 family protein [Caulobacteraceae bacterium]
MPDGELSIWAVSDGRAGIEAQALGLAQAVARLRPAQVAVKRLAFRRAGRRPWWLHLRPLHDLEPSSGIAPPWPDLWIACGRASVALSMRVRRWSGGRTFVVQLQDPLAPAAAFDLVIPPRHDQLAGPNVLPILGSPHRLTPERLAEEAAAFQPLIDPLPRPRVAVLIGGKSKAFDLPPGRAAEMAREIGEAVQAAGGSVMVTFSRRTPDDARAVLAARLAELPGVVWNGEGPNPYFAFLEAADHILVTEDSTNMAAEAASTGKPVHILALPGGSAKFRRFHAELADAGAARPFAGKLDGWSYAPLRETERAAAEILRRLQARDGGAA